MSKTLIAIIAIVVIVIVGYWIYQLISASQEITEAEAKNCEVNSDCVVFGEDGDCNCGCFNKNYQWKKEGDCFCAAPKSCKCVNGKCEGVFEEEPVVSTEEACVNSGGEITTSLCCEATGDYPNLCLVGPCGCSPENSHQVKICDCEEGKCFDGNTCVPDDKNFLEEIEVNACAKDGETFSTVVEGHLDSCCEGLKEWTPIPDTRFSIADVCYEVGQPSESNIGLCIKCGDGVCGKHPIYDENPCNCPEDCAGKNKAHFSSIEEFCQSNDWKISLSKACEEQEPIKGSPICGLCTP